jgi:hypothetical protein
MMVSNKWVVVVIFQEERFEGHVASKPYLERAKASTIGDVPSSAPTQKKVDEMMV